jgi:hypothetical protein
MSQVRPMNPASRAGFATCLVLLALTGRAAELPEKIRQAWEERERKSATIEIKWKGTETHSNYYLQLWKGIPDKGQPLEAMLRERELQVDGEKLRHARWGKDTNGTYESCDVFDGERSFGVVLKEGKPVQTRIHATPVQWPLDVGLHPLDWAIRPRIAILTRKTIGDIEVGEAPLPGRDGKFVTLTQVSDLKDRKRRIFWLDPKTYDIVHMEARNDLKSLYQFSVRYGRIDAPWVPKSWVMEFGIDVEHGPWITQAMQVESVTLPKAIPAEKFELKLVPGMTLFETTAEGEKAYRIDANGKKVLLPKEEE